ncbi:MAG: choice-of-anchor A family protein [Microcoleaceae cyanobacterium]
MTLSLKPVTMMAVSAVATSLAVGLAGSASALTLGDYNLVVFEDLQSNSEVEGNAFIGGNLSGSSSNYCIKCNSGGNFQPFDGVGLKVVGNIEGNPKQVNNGADLQYGGNLNSIVNMNGGGSKSQNSALATEFGQLKNFLTNTSSELSNLGANSTVVIPGQQPGAVKFNSSGDDIAVFNIDASQLFSNKTQQIELNLNGSESAVINVSGTSANWTQGNIVGGFTGDSIQQKVLWNFYEAETLNFNNALHGSLLAPLAHLTNQTEMEGSIVVKSFNQRGEVHLPVFTGKLPKKEIPAEEVPEPSFMLAAALGLGFISKFKRISSSSNRKAES